MNTTQQPEALRLAAWLNEGAWRKMSLGDTEAAGRELRRQHAEITTLQAGYAAARLEIQSLRAREWISVADRLPEPGKPVLLDVGKKYPIRAMWVPRNTLEVGADADEGFGEYDPATDTYYCAEGWYEWNHHEDTHWLVSASPRAWCELPMPTAQADRAARAQAAPAPGVPSDPVGWIDDGGMLFWKSAPLPDGAEIYAAPQPPAAGSAADQQLDDALRDRDQAEDYIDALLDEVLGADRPEWSSAYGWSEALDDVQERITALHTPAITKAWHQFQKAIGSTQSPAPAQPPVEAQEPVATLHDDGYWTPTKTEAGRQLNERMMRVGSRVAVYTHPAPQPAAPADGDALTQEEAKLLEKVISDFEECGETDVPDSALRRFAALGHLECVHYHVMPSAQDAIDAAMAARKGGA